MIKPFDRSVLMLLPLSMLDAEFVLINGIRLTFGDDACAGRFGDCPAWLQRFNFQFTHLGTLTDV